MVWCWKARVFDRICFWFGTSVQGVVPGRKSICMKASKFQPQEIQSQPGGSWSMMVWAVVTKAWLKIVSSSQMVMGWVAALACASATCDGTLPTAPLV